MWFSWPEGGCTAGKVTNNGAPIPLDQGVTLSSLNGLAYTGSASQGTDCDMAQNVQRQLVGNWVGANIVDSGSSAQTPHGNGCERIGR